MLKHRFSKIGLFILVGFSLLLTAGFALNSPPGNQPVSLSTDRPFVVKIHAQWCPICLVGKGMWSKLQTAYSEKANLVVFDVTSKARSEASRAEAKRLGLGDFFEEHHHEVGSVFVVDRSGKMQSVIPGLSDFAAHTQAIDETLAGSKR